VTRLLAIANDFVQPPAAELGTAKKIGFSLAASGLYIPASVLVDENGNTIDSAIAALAGAERGVVTRPAYGTIPIIGKALPANGAGQNALPVWNAAIQMATYDSGVRAIASGTLTASTFKAILSFEHGATSTKRVKIRRIFVGGIQTVAAAGMIDIQLMRGTAASTAGTARVPTPRVASDPACECVVKSLPTIVAATIVDDIPWGATPATANSSMPTALVYDWQEAGEAKAYELRPGVLESLVVGIISTAAQAVTMTLSIDFTEE
jgi:hypothetical protein